MALIVLVDGFLTFWPSKVIADCCNGVSTTSGPLARPICSRLR